MTAQEVEQAAQRYFVRDNRVVGFFVPEDSPQRAEIPAAPDRGAAAGRLQAVGAGQAAEAFDPSQDNIDKRTRIADVSAT